MEKIKLNPGSRYHVLVGGGHPEAQTIEHLTGSDGYIHNLFPSAPIIINEDHLVYMLCMDHKDEWSDMWNWDKRSLEDVLSKGRYKCICTANPTDAVLDWHGDLFLKVPFGDLPTWSEKLSSKFKDVQLVLGFNDLYLICTYYEPTEVKRTGEMIEIPNLRASIEDIITDFEKKGYEEASSTRLDYLLSTNLEAASSPIFETLSPL